MNFHISLLKIALALATTSAFSPHIPVAYRSKWSLVQSSHQDLYDAEEEAAFDAHNLSDAGMETAAMERAVMMANDARLRKKKSSAKKEDNQNTKDTATAEPMDKPLSDHQSLFEAEEEAAFDAHDLSDAGMEAAAMERAVMMANDARLRKKKSSAKKEDDQKTKDTTATTATTEPMDQSLGDHQSLFEAEEEAAFDAHDLSDAGMEAAAMERAVMIANNLLHKKREELKDKTENAKMVEKEYVLVKQATRDLAKLFRSYEADPSKFRKEFALRGKDESSLAIEMLEKVIAETSEEMLELQREENDIIANFLEALHEEEMAEAIAARLESQEEAARASLKLVEEFDDDYEVNERKRDMSSFHFIKEQEKLERSLKEKALNDENKFLTEDYEIKKHLEQLKQKERNLKADLRSIQEIIREQLRREWEAESNTQKD